MQLPRDEPRGSVVSFARGKLRDLSTCSWQIDEYAKRDDDNRRYCLAAGNPAIQT